MDILERAIEITKRKQLGYGSFCAFIDLLGVSNQVLNDCEVAQKRIDNLHQGIACSLEIYPGLEDCKATFFGDSIVILKEFDLGEVSRSMGSSRSRDQWGQINGVRLD